MDEAAWWRGAAIYQIYPRSFQDSTGTGTGDLKGVEQRLEHVAGLGVDAIWLSPVFRSPMADMGYDISDYRDIDPIFGTLADFDAVVARAHALGLKVMIDLVFSHSSDQHPWFQESRAAREGPKADWYVWADPKPDGSPPTNWHSVFGGPAWSWNPKRQQYYMHNFLPSQPDLNFWNADVQEAVLDYVRFWLDRGVDGFRLDSINYCFHDRALRDNPPLADRSGIGLTAGTVYGYQAHLYDKTQPEMLPFLERVRALLDLYAERTTVGEVGDEARSLQTMAAYTAGGDKLHMAYSFDLLGPTFTPAHIRDCVEAFDAAGGAWPCWAFSNHDVPRHASRFALTGASVERIAEFSVALLVCLRGSVCLYQGEELGLPEAELAYEDLTDPVGLAFWPEIKGRDGCRTPMPWAAEAPQAGFSTAARTWLPVAEAHRALAVDQGGPVLAAYRRMLALRREVAELRTGALRFLDWGEQGLVFLREGPGRVVCLFNFGDNPLSFTAADEWTLTEVAAERGTVDGGSITLGPYGFYLGRIS
ncbi:MAG: alpha-glucosidase [Pseudomonadota bacterium]